MRDTWVTSLFAAGKVSGPVAREAYLRCVSRAQYNVAQLDMVLRERRKADQARRVLENEVKLRSTTKPWRNYPTIDAWKMQYRKFKGRYLFLSSTAPARLERLGSLWVCQRPGGRFIVTAPWACRTCGGTALRRMTALCLTSCRPTSPSSSRSSSKPPTRLSHWGPRRQCPTRIRSTCTGA